MRASSALAIVGHENDRPTRWARRAQRVTRRTRADVPHARSRPADRTAQGTSVVVAVPDVEPDDVAVAAGALDAPAALSDPDDVARVQGPRCAFLATPARACVQKLPPPLDSLKPACARRSRQGRCQAHLRRWTLSGQQHAAAEPRLLSSDPISRQNVAPRCASASSQNSATSGCFSSAAWTMPRWTPRPRPWTRRSSRRPASWAGADESSTTDGMSRGAKV